MKDRITITTANPHHLDLGMHVVVNRTGYRVIDVLSATQVLLDRPWWMPLYDAWSVVRRPFDWVRFRLRSVWWRLLEVFDREA